ncbi:MULTISPECIES: SDR family oxidoreductase [unclassified Roseovarius]|uniref:SDR family oxidoreductase n=1 Tax=unclassified Roseovarius TaxID=2614913 RepID=UPI00273EE4F7|nr:SDR family oxidoreductase [Roseovarius sp. MMSF_3350]
MSRTCIEGKNILITGGAKNLGGLISRDLAERGAKGVAIHHHGDNSRNDAEATAKAVEAAGAKAAILKGDLTTDAANAKLFEDAKAGLGSIDIAINTVGQVLRKPIAETSEEEFDQMSAVNNKSAYFFIKQAGKHLEDEGALLTIVTSLLGAFAPGYSTYGGGKAPVEHYTRAAAKEFGERGISVNAIGPGPMDTPFFYGQENDDTIAFHKMMTALSDYSTKGLTDIEDIAPWVRFIVTEGWWMTGQTILINGGYTTK